MNKYRNILVVVDNDMTCSIAIQRAVSIAQLEGEGCAKIKLLLVIYDFSYELTSILPHEERDEMRTSVIAEKTAFMENMIADYAKQVDIELKTVWNSKDFEAILQEVKDYNHDLVIKRTQLHPSLVSYIFTPSDWHLIRKCPVPLLLAKDEHWQQGGVVLGAVTCDDAVNNNDDLNHRIINETLAVASLLNAQAHIINAYAATPVNIAIELPDFDPQAYDEALKKHHWEKLTDYANHYKIPHTCIHLAQGSPEEILPDIAQQLQAHTLILGSYGRTGLSAALVGNTAEQILDQAACDLLVIKNHHTEE